MTTQVVPEIIKSKKDWTLQIVITHEILKTTKQDYSDS